MMWQDWDQEVVAVKFAGTVLSAENLFNYSHRNGEEQNYSLYKFITSILDFVMGVTTAAMPTKLEHIHSPRKN